MPPPVKALRQRKSTGSLPITRDCTVSPKKRRKNKGPNSRRSTTFSRVIGGIIILTITIAAFFLHHKSDSDSDNDENGFKGFKVTSLPLFRGMRRQIDTKSEDEASIDTYTCSNGKIVPMNDDYCDCPEGGDETLTSACSHITVQTQMFTCKDGVLKIFSSRVRDGIVGECVFTSIILIVSLLLDCDDGSDEYMSRTHS